MISNNDKIKVSIVIPIYNGGAYIDKLFDSLLNQTYKNLDIIIVDDFSTDDTYEKVNYYVSIDNRVKLYKAEKKGGNAAKGYEFGLKKIVGDYVLFLTHDDTIDYNFVDECINQIKKTNAEVCIYNLVFSYDDKKIYNKFKYPINKNYNETYNGKDVFIDTLTWKQSANALISKKLIDRIGYDAMYYNSEEYYFRKYILNANLIICANTNYYYYQSNKNAITKVWKTFWIETLITDTMLLNDMINHNFPFDEIKKFYDFVFKKWITRPFAFVKYFKSHCFKFNETRYYFSNWLFVKKELKRIKVLMCDTKK